MTPEILALRSKTGHSEEEIHRVIAAREQCRQDGMLRELAQCDLVLSSMLRSECASDTELPWYARADELVGEAIAIYRNIGDKAGLVDALTIVLDHTEERLEEASVLAEELGDEVLVAKVLKARAHRLASIDAEESAALMRRALEIFRRHDKDRAAASCLRSLSLRGDKRFKLETSLESARLYRKAGDRQGAARIMMLSLMCAESLSSLDDRKSYALMMLDDAQAVGDWIGEAIAYGHLARILRLQGNYREAERYRRWSKELRDLLGLGHDTRVPERIPRICRIDEKPKER